jgi:uncharacterized protein (TIGR02599 family)
MPQAGAGLSVCLGRKFDVVARRAGFTILELLVATGIMLAIMGVLVGIVSQTADGTRAARSRVDQFGQAQRAFEMLTQRIGQATLNSYWDSYSVSSTVRRYQRRSELRFVCGPMQCGANRLDAQSQRVRPGHGVFFQTTSGRPGSDRDPALLGLEDLLSSWGYFVEAGTEPLPPFLASQTALQPFAPRLMEFCEPAKQLSIYSFTSGRPDYANNLPDYTGFEWFRVPLANPALVRTAADNIAVLLVQPKLTAPEAARLFPLASAEERETMLAPELFYHSGATPPAGTDAAHNMRHRLPAVVEVTMVALDAATVGRLYSASSPDPLQLGDAFRDAMNLRRELQGDPANPKADSLEGRLLARHANYRIFTATVPIRSAQ